MGPKTNPDIDLGLAISGLTLRYGDTRSQAELAAFCNCSTQRIDQIEQGALRKLRNALLFSKKSEYAELREFFFGGGLNENLPWHRHRTTGQSPNGS